MRALAVSNEVETEGARADWYERVSRMASMQGRVYRWAD